MKKRLDFWLIESRRTLNCPPIVADTRSEALEQLEMNGYENYYDVLYWMQVNYESGAGLLNSVLENGEDGLRHIGEIRKKEVL